MEEKALENQKILTDFTIEWNTKKSQKKPKKSKVEKMIAEQNKQRKKRQKKIEMEDQRLMGLNESSNSSDNEEYNPFEATQP